MGCLMLTARLCQRLIPWLQQKGTLDLPEARRSHANPTPRGGGIATSAVLVLVWGLFCAWPTAPASLPLAVSVMAALAMVAYANDSGWLGQAHLGLRLLVQIAGVLWCLSASPLVPLAVWLAWPMWLVFALLAFGWVWLINLYNFMDGIDELTASYTSLAALGIVLLVLASTLPALLALQALALLAVMLGFWFYNRHPAKLFLGDVGSIPLGFAVGYLLLQLALSGFVWQALLLIGYYTLDATLTLLWRIYCRHKFWQAHRLHFYQRALAGVAGKHSAIIKYIMLAQALIVALTLASVKQPLFILAAAMVIVLLLATLQFLSTRHEK